MSKKKVITYGRKFRDKSGRTVRYVYKHRKKIGLVVLLHVDAILPDSEAQLKKQKTAIGLPNPFGPLFMFLGN